MCRIACAEFGAALNCVGAPVPIGPPRGLPVLTDDSKGLSGSHPQRTIAAKKSAADHWTLSALIGLETALASSLGAADKADPLQFGHRSISGHRFPNQLAGMYLKEVEIENADLQGN
jgi:hypothetical protein